MKLHIADTGSKGKFRFVVDDLSSSGLPYVGRGRTVMEALGNFLHNNQRHLGITEITLDESSQKTELARRKRELSLR